MSTTRTDLRDCATGSPWRPANVICVLEEPLGFLADAGARRTWARRESDEVIWMTSRPMAWQDRLVSEHRQRIVIGLIIPITGALLFCSIRRTRNAFSMRDACHRNSGEPDVPRNSELLLHWVLGRGCRSLPGDLSQEYAQMLEDGCLIVEANRWYRWQVFHSIAPVTARRVESALMRELRRDALTRRS